MVVELDMQELLDEKYRRQQNNQLEKIEAENIVVIIRQDLNTSTPIILSNFITLNE